VNRVSGWTPAGYPARRHLHRLPRRRGGQADAPAVPPLGEDAAGVGYTILGGPARSGRDVVLAEGEQSTMAVRVGFCGTGGIATAHMANLLRIPDAEVVALYDIDPSRCQAAVERVNLQARLAARPDGPAPRLLEPTVYTEYEQMLREARLDALYITIPPFAHGQGELEIRAAEAGIALMVEKPVALSLDVARRVAEVIDRSGIISAVGYQTRYSEATDRAREALGSRTIVLVLGYYLGGMPQTPWWRVQAQSGGQLVEQATHTVDLMRYLAGEITSVYCLEATRVLGDVPNFDIADVATTAMRFKSGAIGNITNTCALAGVSPSYSHGVQVYTRDLIVEVWDRRMKLIEPGRTQEIVTPQAPIFLADQAFIEAVKTHDQSKIRCSYAEGVRTLAVTLAALESARSGMPVALD